MSKHLVLYDPYAQKFTAQMIRWWEQNGYEVAYSNYYNPELVAWADILYFFTCDNNLASATNPGAAILDDNANFQPWGLEGHDLTGKKIIVQPIDIEVHQGHFASSKWGLVDDIIFIAPHIRNLVNEYELPEYNPKTKIHTIPFCVDLEKFTFAKRGPGFDIAVVSEKWSSKGTHELLYIALMLKRIDPRYKIHWLGQRSDSPWEFAWFDDFVVRHDLNIEFTNVLQGGETVNDFLEGKNYLLHGSIKEAFSAAMAEAAAKGIKVIANRFFGADWLWGDSGFLWDTPDQAVEMITEPTYDSASYRQYLIDHEFTLPQMMQKIDEVFRERL